MIQASGIAYVDITTGDFYTTKTNHLSILIDEIAKVQSIGDHT